RKLGVPMGSLSILACPLCKNSLHVSNGVIEDNQIVDADIYCACGYHSTIQDGIYVDEAALREKKLNGEKMPTKEEYMEKASNSFINFMYKGITTLIEQINNYGKETTYIMELNNCVGFFLLQYIRFLPRKSTYILIDYDKERIKQLKIDLEMHYEHDNFIFLCCDIHRLPIARASINVMADFWMTKSYAESTGEFLPDRVLPLLKEDGLFVASFQGIEKNVSSNNKFMSANYLKPDVIVNKLSAHNLKEVNFIETQPIVEDNPYNKDIQGVEIYQAIYAGTKNKQRAAYNKVVRIK
ncbi:MAG: hypothetical protein NUK65_01515, partial [Firmicutes bacterium]|nr:hypothetical protein [Bacillota bacterium]